MPALNTLHIHVEHMPMADVMTVNDSEAPGVYEVKVSSGLTSAQAAGAAMQAFEEAVQFDTPGFFDVRVIDPVTSCRLVGCEDVDSERVTYQFIGKVSDVLPEATLTVSLKVNYLPRGESVQHLLRLLQQAIETELRSDKIVGVTEAELTSFTLDISDTTDVIEIPEPSHVNTFAKGIDMKPAEQVVWITAESATVAVQKVGDGIILTVVPADIVAGPVVTRKVSYAELEHHACSKLNTSLPRVRAFYERNNFSPRQFEVLSPKERMQLIKSSHQADQNAYAFS